MEVEWLLAKGSAVRESRQTDRLSREWKASRGDQSKGFQRGGVRVPGDSFKQVSYTV